ncbi:uncharacterized protein F4807DRAFT_426522 [Annulohypoxylon truncatum]|uniref:uncharacterized protein n=1 Tax=Annulohypoxylon truncatum TaxID=327061 RepID=UPI002007D8FC|nr:uncharacterized protein F4807DRAFT_426522 [Annulohypoxylon truncatum]KAI1209382.1 hypothetical protein F4807DRAFT_426522 [Annulohypoxylon truncatum]
MTTSGQKDQNKSGKGMRGFDLGSVDALPNVDLASGIFEAPGAISEPGVGKGSTGDSKRSGGGSGGGGSSDHKLKDTAGAGAMIL